MKKNNISHFLIKPIILLIILFFSTQTLPSFAIAPIIVNMKLTKVKSENQTTAAILPKIAKAIKLGQSDCGIELFKRTTANLNLKQKNIIQTDIATCYYMNGDNAAALNMAAAIIKESQLLQPAWIAALAAWRMNNYSQARDYFEIVYQHKDASDKTIAAAAFWAARTDIMTKNFNSLLKHINIATSYPQTFYGILSTRLMGQNISQPENIDAATIPSVSPKPILKWVPLGGFKIEQSLLGAIIKTESGFNSKAVSRKGAVGLMQIMPSTARIIARQINLPRSRINNKNPTINLAIGQAYIAYLMKEKDIGNNLFYLTAAYNAGPARVIKWIEEIKSGGDPLLFIETIPMASVRSYVLNIMIDYWIYQKRLGHATTTLDEIAAGLWPLYQSTPKLLSNKI